MVRQFHEDLSSVPFLDLDFTGTCWDTVAKCNEVGLRFSDTDIPFPNRMVVDYTVAGTWTHVAGKGWRPDILVDYDGPAILVPLIRSSNFQVEVVLDFQDALVAQQCEVFLGYISASHHAGAFAWLLEDHAGQIEYQALSRTNDGDDTYTTRYTGTAFNLGAASCDFGFHYLTGCIGVYDDQDNLWHNFVGTQSAGIAYTPAHAFIQIIRRGTTIDVVYLASLKLIYLV